MGGALETRFRVRWQLCPFLFIFIALSHLGFTPQICCSQVILSEIMFDPDTLESHNEYVELFNAGGSAVSLAQWRIGDNNELDRLTDTGYGLILAPFQFAVILDASYFGNSTVYDHLIPDSALILTIDDGSFGSFGWSNSMPEAVNLVDVNGDTVQKYIYSLNNLPGYSDEKIILSTDNSVYNWGNSRMIRGTPGRSNSITPLPVDGVMDSVWIEPSYPIQGDEFTLWGKLRNAGLETIFQLNIHGYSDFNSNSILDPDELLFTESIIASLALGDTMQLNWTISSQPPGQYRYGLWLELETDMNPDNNSDFVEVEIELATLPLVINEIMFQPLAGKSEWIELFNRGTYAVDLKNWSFTDARDSITITQTSKIIDPNDYLVVAKDSSILEHHNIPWNRLTIHSSFPTLNNDLDDLKLFSYSGRLSDRVNYSGSWMRRESPAGTSLERINPAISSMLPDNWAASTSPAGSTPGQLNSIYVSQPVERSLISLNPNPFSPDGDGFEDYVIIQCLLPFAVGYVSIDIFDTAGRKIRRLANREPSGQSKNFIWNGKDGSGRVARIGIYIILIRIFQPDDQLFKELKRTVILTKRY